MAENVRTLLIVDDEQDIRDAVSGILEAEGVIVKSAGNITEALQIIENGGITAILSDIAMPGGSGIELLTKVRGIGLDTPFVFLTAFDSKNYITQAVQLGATDFLSKPFQPNELVEVMFRVLEIGYRLTKTALNDKDKKTVNLLKIANSKRRNVA